MKFILMAMKSSVNMRVHYLFNIFYFSCNAYCNDTIY